MKIGILRTVLKHTREINDYALKTVTIFTHYAEILKKKLMCHWGSECFYEDQQLVKGCLGQRHLSYDLHASHFRHLRHLRIHHHSATTTSPSTGTGSSTGSTVSGKAESEATTLSTTTTTKGSARVFSLPAVLLAFAVAFFLR
ncbi:hypothetical protein QR680_019181 [Steinernema hermaphroditum]|uniref:Uncharacterized protein n=1 Tax=Steinernema hermaphroditum TaxID=289476 RepID=A0AA39HK80_9BILA|nr:hypothetical protein QR680_019181 [Steinernema hermaphroditum]